MTALVIDRATPALGEHASATFSPDRQHRYALTRSWDDRLAAATWIMCNPSTADAFAEDPTVRRCIGYARAWRCGGLLVLNLFALRSTDPAALYRHPDPVGVDNDAVIGGYLNHIADTAGVVVHGPVIAAWGINGAHLERGNQVAALAAARGVQLHALAVTKEGHPGHPLYLPKTAQPVPYTPLTAVETR